MKTVVRLCLLATGLSLAAVASAAEPPAEPAFGYYNGIKVAIDPATGRLRQPTAEEVRELRTAMPAGTNARGTAKNNGRRGPANETEARQTLRSLGNGGGVMAQVPEDRMTALTATVQADGSVQIDHAGGPDQVPVAAAQGEVSE